MVNKTIIILAGLVLIGCSNTTKESEEIETSSIEVKNTPNPDYAEYRKQWGHRNNNPTKGYVLEDGKIVKEPKDVYMDDLPFGKVFNLQYRNKGEGHTFWWRGDQYTTDILKSKKGETNDE